MLSFLTEYFIGGTRYCSEIWAADLAEARHFAIRRNIGERVISEGGNGPRDSETGDAAQPAPGVADIVARTPEDADMMDPDDMAEAFHAACWLGFLALSSGVATPREILGDEGLLHRLAHHATVDFRDPAQRRLEIRMLARDIETRIPGWRPLSARDLPPPRKRTMADLFGFSRAEMRRGLRAVARAMGAPQ